MRFRKHFTQKSPSYLIDYCHLLWCVCWQICTQIYFCPSKNISQFGIHIKTDMKIHRFRFLEFIRLPQYYFGAQQVIVTNQATIEKSTTTKRKIPTPPPPPPATATKPKSSKWQKTSHFESSKLLWFISNGFTNILGCFAKLWLINSYGMAFVCVCFSFLLL